MKRTPVPILLTLLLLGDRPVRGQSLPARATDIELRGLRSLGPAGGALCVGTLNAIRAELVLHGPPPPGPVPLRLVVRLPGADPIGTLAAEGSVAFLAGATTATFTFLNVEVPARLEGRGALLEVRANLDQAMGERDPRNNVRALPLDGTVDWRCRR